MRKLFAKAQDPISCETHALGAVAALGGGLLYLLRGVWTDAAIPAVAAALCFCLSMAALYAASAIYHYYPGTAASGGVKRVLRKMDHSMIYVLIAGSYTPFCVVLLPQPRGTQFCLIRWLRCCGSMHRGCCPRQYISSWDGPWCLWQRTSPLWASPA